MQTFFITSIKDELGATRVVIDDIKSGREKRRERRALERKKFTK